MPKFLGTLSLICRICLGQKLQRTRLHTQGRGGDSCLLFFRELGAQLVPSFSCSYSHVFFNEALVEMGTLVHTGQNIRLLCNTNLILFYSLADLLQHNGFICLIIRYFEQFIHALAPKYTMVCSGATAAVLKEKLLSLGSSGILAEHQLQAQLQEQHLKG